MGYLLKKKSFLVLFTILTVAMQITVASSLLTTEVTLKSSGLISYSQSPSVARPLHVEGNKVKDNSGNVVYLRGFNRHGTYEHPSGNWGAYGIYNRTNVDLVLDRMKSYGANVMQYFVVLYYWIYNPTVQTESGTITYRQALEDLITRCEQRGIYFRLCPYSVYPQNCPIHGDHGCSRDDMGFDPWTTDGHEGLVPNQAAFTNLIMDMVDLLGSHNNLIIKFWDEPWPTVQGSYYANLWQSVWQSTINAVRQKELEKGYVNHLIIVQLTCGLRYGLLTDPCSNFNWYWTNPLNDPAHNLVYVQSCFRYYGAVGWQEPKTSRPYTYEEIKAIYEEEGVKAISQEVPVVIGIGAHIPTGNTEPTGTEYAWMQNSLRIFNEWGIGYLGWVWWDATQFAELQSGTEKTTGGTVNQYGQLLVDAIKQG